MVAVPHPTATPLSGPDWGVFSAPAAGAAHTHLLDTDWGDGLRFLKAWHAWRRQASRSGRWCYTAVLPGAVPPAPVAVAGLPEDLGPLAQQLAERWRGLLPGVHRLALDEDRVQLSLHLGPLKDALASLDTALDGVWLQSVSTEDCSPVARVLARLCLPGARLWTHKAPDAMPLALLAQGFEPEATRAAAPNTTTYVHRPRWAGQRHLRQPSVTPPTQAIVVGAGLAGAGVAHALAQRGWQVTVLDRAHTPACGASGLPVGLVAPHVSPDNAALSRLSRQGVRSTLARAQALLHEGQDWARSGVLEHRVEGKRALPPPERWPPPWGAHWSRDATPAECAAAELPEQAAALWHAWAGWIRPAALVQAQLAHPGIAWQGGGEVAELRRQGPHWQALDAQGRALAEAPCLVLASAYDTGRLLARLPNPPVLPVHALRGQVTWGRLADLPVDARDRLPPQPVNGHGSWVHGMPGPGGEPIWLVGSTFDRGATASIVKAEDQAANRQRLATLLPSLAQAMPDAFAQAQGWAGVRCTLPDRLPAVGPIDPQALPGLHVCTGLGARGLTLSVLCGEVLAARLHGEPWPVERKLAQALMAERFQRVR